MLSYVIAAGAAGIVGALTGQGALLWGCRRMIHQRIDRQMSGAIAVIERRSSQLHESFEFTYRNNLRKVEEHVDLLQERQTNQIEVLDKIKEQVAALITREEVTQAFQVMADAQAQQSRADQLARLRTVPAPAPAFAPHEGLEALQGRIESLASQLGL